MEQLQTMQVLQTRKKQLELILWGLYLNDNQDLLPKYNKCLVNTNKKIHSLTVVLSN